MSTIALRNTEISIVDEVTENTPVAEAALGALIFTADGLEVNIDREMVPSNEITGSLTKTAPQPGMYSEDLGFSVTMNIKGKGTKTAPEWAIFMKSIMGAQNANTDNAVKASPAPTTDLFTANVANDFDLGQLLRINDEVVRLEGIATEALSIFPPLSTTPIALDTVSAGISWMLASDSHPSFTAYIYFENLLRLRLAGCKVTNCEMNFEVGQNATMAFTVKALTPTYDRVAQSVTPTYDDTTQPLMCLGITSKTVFSGVITGSPTTTETVLVAPNFQVTTLDSIVVDVGAGVYETVAISAVSGEEGTNQTLTHAALSGAGTATETAYVIHNQCGFVKDTLTISIEMADVAKKCMVSSSGFSARSFSERTVNITRAPFFTNWQEFLLRDNVIGSILQVVLGDTDNNIFCVNVAKQIIGEASLNMDEFLSVDTSLQAVKDSTLGNDHEIVIATF